MFKVNYDTNTGEILGYYPLGVDYPNGVPEPTIEITDEQRQSAYGKIAKVVGGEFVVEDQPEPTPEELKAERMAWLEEWSVKEQQAIVMRKNANEIFTDYDTAMATAKEDGAAYVAEYMRLLGIINNGDDPCKKQAAE